MTTRPAPPPAPILEIETLSVSFMTRGGEMPVIRNFSMAVHPGEVFGLVGESGCGKSTVALGIMQDLGLNGRLVDGAIRFRGRDLTTLSQDELRGIRGNDIAMIYQEPMASLNPAMMVLEQLIEVPMLHEGLTRPEAEARALQMVRDVKLPDPERILKSYPHQLSGGQQQRIVIAMALMSNPGLLILDEPTTALDVTVEAAIMQLLRELCAKHATAMLFISHNLGLVLENCDRICVMYSGEAVETGAIAEVFAHPRHPYTQALLRSVPVPDADKTKRPLQAIPGECPTPNARPQGCNFAPRCMYAQAGRCDADLTVTMATVADAPDHLARCLRHTEVDWDAPSSFGKQTLKTEIGDVILTVDGLRKYYEIGASTFFGKGDADRVVKANEGLTFEVRESETLAIVGESGCGKSTFAKVLMGLETATEGHIYFDGRSIGRTPIQKRDRRTIADIQMVFQNPFDTLNPSMAVGEQILRAMELLGPAMPHRQRREEMLRLLDMVRLPRDFAGRMPRQLSGGQKQRVGIARAFAGRARLIVADEPVSALDVSVQAAILELFNDIQRQEKTTLLFISHDLSLVRYLADRVIVMYLGHVVEIGTVEQVFSPPYHPYTEALLSAIPIADLTAKKAQIVLEGDVPSAIDTPPGCPFQTRCRWKKDVPGNLCATAVPPQVSQAPDHLVKCHLPDHVLRAMPSIFATDPKENDEVSER